MRRRLSCRSTHEAARRGPNVPPPSPEVAPRAFGGLSCGVRRLLWATFGRSLREDVANGCRTGLSGRARPAEGARGRGRAARVSLRAAEQFFIRRTHSASAAPRRAPTALSAPPPQQCLSNASRRGGWPQTARPARLDPAGVCLRGQMGRAEGPEHPQVMGARQRMGMSWASGASPRTTAPSAPASQI